MFSRALCVVFLLASPAFAEILVQEGDYYEHLTTTDDIRITGGRIDRVSIGGNSLTIEGGSIGWIEDYGNAPIVLRTGNFQLDTQPVEFLDVAFLVLDGYTVIPTGGAPGDGFIDVAGWFHDFTYGEFHGILADNYYADVTVDLLEHPPGDAQGDGIVDLQDMNLMRNDFGNDVDPVFDTNGDGAVDLSDINGVRNNFGADYKAASNPVPEPPTTMLLLIGTMAMTLRWLWRCNASPDYRRSRGPNFG